VPSILVRGEVDVVPRHVRRRAAHEQVGAGVVRNELRRARDVEIVVSRIRDVDRRVQRGDGRKHAPRTPGRRPV
jgi:hypothetical protein